MKNCLILLMLFSLLTANVVVVSAQSHIRVPLTRKLENGVFNPTRQFGEYVSKYDSFHFDSTSFKQFAVWKFIYDRSQSAFNKFIKSNRTDSTFIPLQNKFGWDTSVLSAGYDNSIYIFSGLKQNGEYILIPDKNSNKDFTDDREYLYRMQKVPIDSVKGLTNQLPVIEFSIPLMTNGIIKQHTIAVKFIPKAYFGNFQAKFRPPVADSLLFVSSLNEYLEGELEIKNIQNTILIRNSSHDVRYNKESVQFYIPPKNLAINEDVNTTSLYKIGDTIPIESELYRLSYLDIWGEFLDLVYAGENMGIGIDSGLLARNASGKNVLTGKQISLNDFRGSYLLIDFWGTWCAPCKEILPDLKNISTRYSKKSLKVLSIAYDQNADIVKRFIEREKMQWDNIFEPFNITNAPSMVNDYKVESFPTTILIDPQGKILSRATSVQEFKKIKELIEQLLDQ